MVGPYQEEADRDNIKRIIDVERQLRLALLIPKRIEKDQKETDPSSPNGPE
jgi:hypothetical protein